MKRQKPETLGDILPRFLRTYSLESPLEEYKLMRLWPEVVPASVAAKTERMHISNGVLHVRISSPALKANLMMQRQTLVGKLNALVGHAVISDIKLL